MASHDGELNDSRRRDRVSAPERPEPEAGGGYDGPETGGYPSQRPKRRWVYVGVLIILVILIWGAVRAARKPEMPGAGAPGGRQRGGQPQPVVAATAHKGDIDVFFTGLGSVTPLSTVTVRSRVDGQLMSVRFREGQVVRKGELLAEIDDRPFRVQLTQAEGQLAKDQAALNNARLDLERYETLIKRNAVAQQVLATQQAQVAVDEGAVKADQGAIDAAKLNITYSHIEAPIAGKVGLRLVDPGNIVHVSDANGMLVITQVQPISVIFTIPEDQLDAVLKKSAGGNPLKVDAFDRTLTQKIASGRLTTVDNQIDPTTGTLKLRATFDNRDSALFPNEFVNARLLLEHKTGVVLVPNAAIQRNGQRTFVYLVKPDKTVTIRNVTVGTTQGDQTEVSQGLNEGDMVVTTGVDKLLEGSKVIPQSPQGDGRPGGAQPLGTEGRNGAGQNAHQNGRRGGAAQ
jgi:multidrug efflux system membrane fusion protein